MSRTYKDIPLWKDVTDKQWNDWHWQLKNRITTVEELKCVINLTPEEEQGITECLKVLRMAITPHYAMLMDPDDPECPVRKQAVPTVLELVRDKEDMDDSTFEDVDSPAPHLTHRYPDRALLLTTDQCSMYCRHCTRRRLVGNTDAAFKVEEYEEAFRYLENTTQIRDVVISGGDPLTLSDEKVEYILQRVTSIPHIEMVRIGTRTPVVMPQRITDELCQIIKKYHPVFINTHFNHVKEMTKANEIALAKLADAGCPLGNQSVLLKGVNDCPNRQKRLVHALVKNRVRPYYLYQCDRSVGIQHFCTSVDKGEKLIDVDIRIISAMNVSPFEAIEKKQLRKDLFYRLGVIQIELPPLKKRKGDIELLSNHFIKKFNLSMKKEIKGLSDIVLEVFNSYGWPGNIRELKNAIEYAFNIADGQIIQPTDIPEYILTCMNTSTALSHQSETTINIPLKQQLEHYECEIIKNALDKCKTHAQAAEILGITRQSLQYKISKYNL